MAVNPQILQQYIDAYNQQLEQWQRQGKAYNAAVGAYNTAAPAWQKQCTPAFNTWKGEVEHTQIPGIHNQDNINYHMGVANRYNQNLYNIEKQRPMEPSAVQGLFNENVYLANNPDVAAAVKAGQFKSGLAHYLQYGRNENRNAAVGGTKTETALKNAADWQKNTEAAYLQYLDEAQHTRTMGIHNQDNINYHNARVAQFQKAYEDLLKQRPGMPEFTGQQPTFTAEQMRAMSGKVTPGQQLLTEQGGLIANERVSAAAERNSPSFISGLLTLARNQRS